MYNIHEIIEEMIKHQESLQPTVMYGRGLYKNNKNSNKFEVNELQIDVPQITFNTLNYGLFIKINTNKIHIIAKTGSSIKLHEYDDRMMIYRELYNKLIDFAENILELSVEDFTNETIKYFNHTSCLIPRSRISRFE